MPATRSAKKAGPLSISANTNLNYEHVQVDAADVARGKELDSEIRACEARLEELQKACGKLQARAAALQAQLDDVGGPELRQQRAKVAQMQKVRSGLCIVLAKLQDRRGNQLITGLYSKRWQESGQMHADVPDGRRCCMHGLQTGSRV